MAKPNELLLEFLTSENPLTLAKLYIPIKDMIKSAEVIGSGINGETHKICLESSGRDCVLVKENSWEEKAILMTRNEYVTQYGAWQQTREYPFLIPRPIKFYRKLLFMQLISNSVTFQKFHDNLNSVPEFRIVLKSLFFQALGCWALIERKYPNFVHLDLNSQNLLVSVVDAPYQMPFFGKIIKKYFLTIIDFGYASLDSKNSDFYVQKYHEVLLLFGKYYKNNSLYWLKFLLPALLPYMKPKSPENDYYNLTMIHSLVSDKESDTKLRYLSQRQFLTKEYQENLDITVSVPLANVRFSSEALLKLPFFDDL